MPIDKGLVILNSCFVCFVRNVGTSSDTNTKSKPGRRRRVRHTNTKKQKVKISIIMNKHRLPWLNYQKHLSQMLNINYFCSE